MSVKTTLTHKVGPLPVWAWAAIAGATIAAVIYLQRQRAGNTADGTAVDTGTQGLGIDPTTGLPYASEFGSGGGLSSGGTTPTLASEIGDVTGVIGALQAAGLYPTSAVATNDASSGSGGLIDLAPGHTYYDPVTGETVNGPEQAAAAQKSGTVSSIGKTAVDRAAATVSSGKIGPINRRRLNNAGFTNAQIDYHLKRKTPLGQPSGVAAVHKEQAKQEAKKNNAAASHPNQKQNVASPDHGKPPTPAERWAANPNHTITYAQHQKNVAKSKAKK